MRAICICFGALGLLRSVNGFPGAGIIRLSVVLLTLLLAALAGENEQARTDFQNHLIGHRGCFIDRQENTLGAIQFSIETSHLRWVEVDIRRTADGILILMHDSTLTRTTNVEELFPERAPWNTADFTLAEIKQLSAGRFGPWATRPWVPDQSVPTLEEALYMVAGLGANMVLDTKVSGVQNAIRDLLGITSMTDRVKWIVSHSPFIEEIKLAHEAPRIIMNPLFFPVSDPSRISLDYIDTLKTCGITGVGFLRHTNNFEPVMEKDIRRLQAADIELHVLYLRWSHNYDQVRAGIDWVWVDFVQSSARDFYYRDHLIEVSHTVEGGQLFARVPCPQLFPSSGILGRISDNLSVWEESAVVSDGGYLTISRDTGGFLQFILE